MVSTERPPAIVLYDVTRLVNRRRAPHPTGIDRIDLKFAAATFARFGDECLPVMSVGRRPVVLSDIRDLVVDLLASLDAAWFGDVAPSEAVAARIDRLGLTGGGGYGSRRAERAAATRRGGKGGVSSSLRRIARLLRGAFARLDTGAPVGRRVLYVNASHQGLVRHAGALARLTPGADPAVLAYIHDLMPLEVPQFTRADRIAPFAAFVDELVRHRAVFAANSHATAASLAAYLAETAAGEFAAPEVVPPGIEGRAAGALLDRRPAPSGANFVVLGTIEPRKNHRMLLEIWREMAAETTGPIPRLRIVGRRGWDIDDVAALLDGAAELRPHVTEESDLDDRAVRSRLLGATALLFPSYAEGFGFPLAEAVIPWRAACLRSKAASRRDRDHRRRR
jgi:hypothetical protein